MLTKKLTGYPSIDKPWLKYYSEEALNAKLPACTIYDYLYESNKDYRGRTALNYFGRKITYGELFENIEKAARALKQNGVGKGSIVTVLMPTLPETVYLFYALGKIGAIGNMVDPRTSAEGIRDYIQEVGSELLIAVDVVLPKTADILSKTTIKKVLVISPADSLPPVLRTLYKMKQGKRPRVYDACISWKSFIAEEAAYTGTTSAGYEKNRPVVIVHTGGTTGHPKGVLLTNDNLNISAYQCIISGLDFQRKHTWLNIMPPFIAYGVGNGLHLPLIVGMEVILIPQFDPNKFDELLLKHKPNHMTGVPSHYGNIINSQTLKNKDLSYLIAPIVGGDSMNIDLERQTNQFFKKHNAKCHVVKGYGMTEVSAAVSVCATDSCNQIGSVGIPFTHTVISIFDVENGEELMYNQQGEVCITGPNTMLGYYKNPKATAEIIVRHKDGLDWVHSGDIGYMTEDGMLFIVDRIKRMIVRHDGFKVFPSMIEKTIASHEAVQSCCVVGIPDKEHSQGKLPAVHVVLAPAFSGQEDAVRQQLAVLCQKELPEYAQPVDYVFRDSLPLTSIGKVDYRALEEKGSKNIE